MWLSGHEFLTSMLGNHSLSESVAMFSLCDVVGQSSLPSCTEKTTLLGRSKAAINDGVHKHYKAVA